MALVVVVTFGRRPKVNPSIREGGFCRHHGAQFPEQIIFSL